MIERTLCRIGYRKYLFAHLLVLFSFAICLIGSSNALAANAPIQQALIISIPLSDGRPESAEVQLVYKLESELTKAIERSRAGEYDGNEILAKMFTMYAYGPSADKLFDASGKLTNEATAKFLSGFMQAFADWITANTKA